MRETIAVADSGPLIGLARISKLENGIYIRPKLIDAVLHDAGE